MDLRLYMRRLARPHAEGLDLTAQVVGSHQSPHHQAASDYEGKMTSEEMTWTNWINVRCMSRGVFAANLHEVRPPRIPFHPSLPSFHRFSCL